MTGDNFVRSEHPLYIPRVSIKLKQLPDPNERLPFELGAHRFLRRQDLKTWLFLEKRFGFETLDPLFLMLGEEGIEYFSRRARQNDKSYQRREFETYFTLPISVGLYDHRAIEKMIRKLRGWSLVEAAYLESGPATPPSADFLNAAPVGVDVPEARRSNIPGAKGEAINLIDIEQGWLLQDPMMPIFSEPMPAFGCNKIYFPHGTRVVSVVAGRGSMAIAPKANVHLVSRWHLRWDPNKNEFIQPPCDIVSTVDALQYSLKYLTDKGKEGDVILLESQTQNECLPEETELAVFDLIELITGNGFVVIEPTGNPGQGVNIDALIARQSQNGSFEDSGAIVVGAALGDDGHPWASFTNFGQRVDCFAWGRDIDAAGTNNFGGTSGAAAIIAGVALCVQGIAFNTHGRCYKPKQLRDIIKADGTASVSNQTNPIGVMPDLAKIVPIVQSTPPT
jgi:hypothetical protein